MRGSEEALINKITFVKIFFLRNQLNIFFQTSKNYELMSGEKPASGGNNVPRGQTAPGEGIRSLETSGVFRTLNFELYTRPNKFVMGFGLIAITGCIGYLTWMKNQEQEAGLYTAMNDKDELYVTKKRSKWD